VSRTNALCALFKSWTYLQNEGLERKWNSFLCQRYAVKFIINNFNNLFVGNFVDRNYVRVVEVWWDEYSKYFYERKPNAKHVDPGDLTEVKAVRERLQCKSFDWFMKEIGYDLPKHFPLVEPSNAARGHITNVGTNLCVDGHHAGQGDQLALSECASVREGQWMLTWHEDIRPLSGSSK